MLFAHSSLGSVCVRVGVRGCDDTSLARLRENRALNANSRERARAALSSACGGGGQRAPNVYLCMYVCIRNGARCTRQVAWVMKMRGRIERALDACIVYAGVANVFVEGCAVVKEGFGRLFWFDYFFVGE